MAKMSEGTPDPRLTSLHRPAATRAPPDARDLPPVSSSCAFPGAVLRHCSIGVRVLEEQVKHVGAIPVLEVSEQKHRKEILLF